MGLAESPRRTDSGKSNTMILGMDSGLDTPAKERIISDLVMSFSFAALATAFHRTMTENPTISGSHLLVRHFSDPMHQYAKIPRHCV